MTCRDMTSRWLEYCAREIRHNRDVISLQDFTHAVTNGLFR